MSGVGRFLLTGISVWNYLVWCAVDFATAGARLSVIFIDVHYGRFGAFPHQVSPHARNVLETVSWEISDTVKYTSLRLKKRNYFWISFMPFPCIFQCI